MRVGNRWIFALLTVWSLTLVAGRAAAQERHRLHYLHHALWELRDARIELRESRWNFGEHKVKAERAIDIVERDRANDVAIPSLPPYRPPPQNRAIDTVSGKA